MLDNTTKNTVEELVRQAMSQNFGSQVQAAKSVGLNRRTFSLARQMILIKDRISSEEDRLVLEKALTVLEPGQVAKAESMTKEIISRYWHKHTRNGICSTATLSRQLYSREKRSPFHWQRVRFDNTIVSIREACTNTEEMEIPPTLSHQERLKAMYTLVESMSALISIVNRLKSGEKDEQA